ncbi:MAG: ABC transporter ATP-binding protein [Bacteroidia bacterium]|jgi:branched-chain amino acid transport system ATP-binding protein|nr:ABC transporter ATP-binding protein [Bacteroidia bacterium]
MESKDTILVAKGISKHFGGVQAIKELDLVIEKNKITGLIGSNGAGKTTFFNLVCGLFPIDSGTIEFDGSVINKLKSYQIARLGIARTYQTLNNFPRLDVFENVRAGIITKYLNEKDETAKVHEMLELLGISHLSKINITNITPVARKLVEVGRALISSPKLVLFDETMAGFNEEETVHLINTIRDINKQGVTFCIIGHTMRAIMDVSDTIIAMHEGSKFAEGTPEEIQKNKDVQRIYVGE